jgi:hypothetical protein
MKKKKTKDPGAVARRLQRKLSMQQGFYDGRFRERTVKDKKKETKRMWARRGKTDDAN